jgi:hypothetical protein
MVAGGPQARQPLSQPMPTSARAPQQLQRCSGSAHAHAHEMLAAKSVTGELGCGAPHCINPQHRTCCVRLGSSSGVHQPECAIAAANHCCCSDIAFCGCRPAASPWRRLCADNRLSSHVRRVPCRPLGVGHQATGRPLTAAWAGAASCGLVAAGLQWWLGVVQGNKLPAVSSRQCRNGRQPGLDSAQG